MPINTGEMTRRRPVTAMVGSGTIAGTKGLEGWPGGLATSLRSATRR